MKPLYIKALSDIYHKDKFFARFTYFVPLIFRNMNESLLFLSF